MNKTLKNILITIASLIIMFSIVGIFILFQEKFKVELDFWIVLVILILSCIFYILYRFQKNKHNSKFKQFVDKVWKYLVEIKI